MLYVGLPPEAAIWRVDGQQWTLREELAALAVERNDMWGLYHAYLQTDKKGRKHLPDKPLEIPRPGESASGPSTERSARKVTEDPDRADAFFAKTPRF